MVIIDNGSTNGVFVDVGSAPPEDHPELYEDEEFLSTGSFMPASRESIDFVCVEDEQLTLKDGSYIRLGPKSVVFKLKLID